MHSLSSPRTLTALATLAASLAFTAQAHAGSATGTPVMSFDAVAAEANTLTVTYQPGPNNIRFDDGARDVTLGGPNCLVETDDGVGGDGGDDAVCGVAALQSITVNLDDLADSATFAGFDNGAAPDVPVTVNGGAGNDTLSAAQIATTLVGGAGDDTVTGGAGIDTVSYGEAGRTGGVIVDLGSSAVQPIATAETETLSGVENATGSAGADRLTGSAAANSLDGAGGDDILQGGLGNDVVTGAAGADTASYADADRTTGVTVNLGTATAQTISGTETETLATVERLVGSAHGDALTDAAGANSLDGAAGDDTITAEPQTTNILTGASTNVGDDYRGGTGTDAVTYATRTLAVVVSLDDSANDGASAELDNVRADVENVTGGPGNDTLTGNTAVNVLSGGAGDDTFAVREGVEDTVTCGAGNDAATVDQLDLVSDCETIDRSPLPIVSAADVAVVEGDDGTATAVVRVALGASVPFPVTVDYATRDGNAVAGSDYDATNGTLTFAPGETEKTVAVAVKGDRDVEANELAAFALSNPTRGALRGEGLTLVGILNDDAPPAPPVAAKVRPAHVVKVAPSRDRKAPYAFKLTGKLTPPAGSTATCAGEQVSLRGILGKATVVRRTVAVRSGCTWTATVKVAAPKGVKTLRRVTLTAKTKGTATLLRAKTKTLRLQIG